MLTLAIEQSTSVSSTALLNHGDVVAEHTWKNSDFPNQHIFSTVLPDLFKETPVEPTDIDIFAVGLGPGSFSGLRISLSLASALALPGQKRVFGVSSGEALAWDLFREKLISPVVIVGDARRGRLWFAQFLATDGLLKMETPYCLIKFEELSGMLDKHSIVASPDWDRIGEKLIESNPGHTTFIEEKRVPRARTIGELALRKIGNSRPQDLFDRTPGRRSLGEVCLAKSEPLTPIYLHPPVFVKPRFE